MKTTASGIVLLIFLGIVHFMKLPIFIAMLDFPVQKSVKDIFRLLKRELLKTGSITNTIVAMKYSQLIM